MTRTVFLTGVSSGLGKAFFDVLSKEKNTSLFCLGRRFLPEQVNRARQSGGRIHLHQADLRHADQLPAAQEMDSFLQNEQVSEVVLIHNAAIIQPIGAVGELDPESIADAVQVNFTTPILLTNSLFSLCTKKSFSVKVLFISSGAAKRPKDGWPIYCATKAGGEMFFNVLAEQVQGHERFSVYNVDPGVMDTNMQQTIRDAIGVHFPTRERFVKFKENGELVSPEQVAASIIRKYL